LETAFLAVANRFNFSAEEIKNMPLSELHFWFKGHQRINKEESGK
jgi:hypothetical protein